MLSNCPQCFRPFVKSRNKVCQACLVQEHEDYQRILDFLRMKPKSTVQEVARETGIPESKILRLLDDGKIQLKREVQSVVTCQRCLRLITDSEKALYEKTGKQLCFQCSNGLADKLKGMSLLGAEASTASPEPANKPEARPRYGLGAR